MSDDIWLPEVEDHDFPAARAYLSLVASPDLVETVVRDLKHSKPVYYKAKDILRASGLELLPMSNAHVSGNIHKLLEGKKLSPVLLLRGDILAGYPLHIADGYHRVCASYQLSEDTPIPCYIVSVRR